MKTIKVGEDAKQSILKGINNVYNCVRGTLGGGGRNAIIDREFSSPLITNDGVSIAKEVEVEDETEMLGVNLMKSVANQTNEEVGDGTTTTTILAKVLIDKCFKELGLAGNVMVLKNKIKIDCEEIVKELKKRAKKIKTQADVEAIAFTSVENKEIAKMIAEIFKKVGKDGFVTYEDSFGYKTEYEVKKGYEIETACKSPYMIGTLKKPAVVVLDRHIQDISEIKVAIDYATERGRNVAIFAQDFSQELISQFVISIMDNKIKIITTRTNKEEMKNIEALTKAGVEDSKIKIGECDEITFKKDKTVIVGGIGDAKDRIKELEEQETSSEYEEEKIKKTVSQLKKGIGVIKIGASTPEEKEYLQYKIEDAINATTASYKEGYVKGGGEELVSIANTLKDNFLSDIIKAPYNQILENNGGELIPEGIIDPVKVIRVSLENAVSLASVVLTTNVSIANKKDGALEK